MRITAFLTALMALALLSTPAKADPPIWINADYVEEAFAQFSENNPSEDDINFVPSPPIETGLAVIHIFKLDGSSDEPSSQTVASPIEMTSPPTPNSTLFVSMAKNFLDKARLDEYKLAKVMDMTEEEQQRPGNRAILNREEEIRANASMANTLTHVLRKIGKLSSNE